ncbi:hypothetical protein [Achromobacter mucicolens]|uniref:Uncharacterized protein n=1 Tax=Achromobacter mucicolens TaxID=1389922 RepID=A0ABM8LM59_9BURK|nr:hypothetical protein [Achromobacter mucicolens]UAN03050.1 hypothetical protein K9D24_02390 [Achromobacter mucicolens]CAB3922048.1 hypothetical protein LMG3415_05632 [Achromobacter mucicolens]
MTTLTLSRVPSTATYEEQQSRLFKTAHAALTFAYNHTDQVYDKPMMARMAEAASGVAGKGLGGTDGAGQAAYIFGALEKLPRLYRAILVARFAPRSDRCKCCQGTVDRHDWLAAVREISDAAACEALSAHPTPRVLRDAIVARYFGKDVKLSEAAERANVSAATATNHNGKIKLWLYGTRTTKQKGGERGAGQKGVEALAMEYAADLLSAKGLCD